MFRIVRPGATPAAVRRSGECSARAAALDLRRDYGVHPFVEVVSPAAKEHALLTVCTAAAAGENHGTHRGCTRGDTAWRLYRHASRPTIRARIGVATDIPEVTL